MAERASGLAPGPAPVGEPSPAHRFPAFRQRFPWIGGDLQTLRNFLLRRHEDLSRWPARRLALDLNDGSGDRLSAALSLPRHDPAERPLVVLIHGLTGCEDSRHVRMSAAQLLGQGYPVLRLNLRGAGPSRPLSRGLYHAGKSEDLQAALESLLASGAAPTGSGLVLIGYSLGANMLIKFLSEDASAALPVLGAVAVSAPIDLKATQLRIMARRNRVYHRYLLRRMVADALAHPDGVSPETRRTLERVESVYDFDDRFVAPANGFDGAEDYYAWSSAWRYLSEVRFPTLVIFARDDPWVPPDAYESFDWSCNAALVPLLSDRGGHVGFHGQGGRTPWHDRCALAFLEPLR